MRRREASQDLREKRGILRRREASRDPKNGENSVKCRHTTARGRSETATSSRFTVGQLSNLPYHHPFHCWARIAASGPPVSLLGKE